MSRIEDRLAIRRRRDRSGRRAAAMSAQEIRSTLPTIRTAKGSSSAMPRRTCAVPPRMSATESHLVTLVVVPREMWSSRRSSRTRSDARGCWRSSVWRPSSIGILLAQWFIMPLAEDHRRDAAASRGAALQSRARQTWRRARRHGDPDRFHDGEVHRCDQPDSRQWSARSRWRATS